MDGETNGRVQSINAYHAARMSRRHRQVQNFPKMLKGSKILEFHDHIWNHHEKCIQISTNMPGIGSLIREITFTFQKCERAKILLL